VAAGARFASFAGFEMPMWYSGIVDEHHAVRQAAGIFDVSHMGQVETSGPEAEALLQRLLSNDVARIAERGAQYSVLCREDGGVLDDLFTYRLGPERFLVSGEQGRIEQAICSRVEGLNPPAGLATFRAESPGGEAVEVVGDHPAVEKGVTLIRDQDRDLAKGVQGGELGRVGDRRGGRIRRLNPALEAEFGGGQPDLAGIG
jgi:hypothetical protein